MTTAIAMMIIYPNNDNNNNNSITKRKIMIITTQKENSHNHDITIIIIMIIILIIILIRTVIVKILIIIIIHNHNINQLIMILIILVQPWNHKKWNLKTMTDKRNTKNRLSLGMNFRTPGNPGPQIQKEFLQKLKERCLFHIFLGRIITNVISSTFKGEKCHQQTSENLIGSCLPFMFLN